QVLTAQVLTTRGRSLPTPGEKRGGGRCCDDGAGWRRGYPMKLVLTANGAPRTIEILTPAPACRFRLDGDPERSAHVEAPEPGVYSVLMDGKSYDARVEEMPGGIVVVLIDGYRLEMEVRDPRRWSRNSAGSGVQGAQSIVAPMPGKVVRVLVATMLCAP